MTEAADYTSALRDLRTKADRQKAAWKATENTIAALEELQRQALDTTKKQK